MAAAMSFTVFFLVWGTLRDGGEETPWIPAGIAASGTLFAAVLVREVILRKVRMRLTATERLERNLRAVGFRGVEHDHHKLTIEKNAAILHEIKRKSEAARVLPKYAAGHREVFEYCEEYLAVNKREFPSVGAGSPRIAALRRGREFAEELHHRHMLKWAEIEARTLFEDAQQRTRRNEKIETAKQALEVITTAAEAYPDDTRLTESAVAIRAFIVGIKVSNLIEKAEKAANKGNREQAEKLYNDALAELGEQRSYDIEQGHVARRIADELEKIQRSEG
jgi:hypothetical protein